MPDSPTPFPPLVTSRLCLRPLRLEDAPTLHRLVNDWEVAKNLASVPFPYPQDLAERWIASTRERLAAGAAWHLAIARAGDDGLLGCIGLSRVPGQRSAELGYWLGRPHWGQGIATEAVRRLLRWAIAHLEIDRITAATLPDNARSAALLRRLGFREEGVGERDFLSRGRRMAVKIWAVERGDLAPFAPPSAPLFPVAAGQGKPLLLVAAVALVDSENRVLLARRPEGKPLAGLWEFPGGKVRPGETPEAALIRELREELGIDVAAQCLAPFAFTSHSYETFHLLMPLYLCRRWQGEPRPLEGQALAWVRPPRLGDYAMPPADRPLVALLRDFL